MKYDVAIVGAGPAGGAAALEFARSSIEAVIIEKKKMPRHKPCGGALPRSLLERFDLGRIPSGIIANRISRIQYQNNYKDTHTVSRPAGREILLVERSAFDHYLVQRARTLTHNRLQLLQGSGVRDVNEYDNHVQLTLDDGRKITASYVIAADGALSRIARKVGLLGKRRYGPAIDAEIALKGEHFTERLECMYMNLFCLPNGYGWIFPKTANILSCGVGSSLNSLNLSRELDIFLNNTFSKNTIESTEISSHPIPIFKGRETIATNRILLAGDAAALVDPISGEGIRFAMMSGKIAAELIIEKSKEHTRDSPLTLSNKYQEMIDKNIGKNLINTLSFAGLAFNNSPAFFYKTFIKGESNFALRGTQ